MTIYAPCIGGLPGVILDGGMRELARRLETLDEGRDESTIIAEVFPWFLWKNARDKAIRLHHAKQLRYLVINCASWGCLKAIQMSEDVRKHGIMVRFIGALDPTALPAGHDPMEVPDNVEQVFEAHARFGWPAMARLRDPSGGKGGKYVYPYLPDPEIKTYTIGHIALGSHDPAHEIIMKHVRPLI